VPTSFPPTPATALAAGKPRDLAPRRLTGITFDKGDWRFNKPQLLQEVAERSATRHLVMNRVALEHIGTRIVDCPWDGAALYEEGIPYDMPLDHLSDGCR